MRFDFRSNGSIDWLAQDGRVWEPSRPFASPIGLRGDFDGDDLVVTRPSGEVVARHPGKFRAPAPGELDEVDPA